MKINMFMGVASMAATLLFAATSVQSVHGGVVDDNATITAIYGSGNPDTGWTSSTGFGTTLALSADNRTTGFVPNADDGVYAFPTGTAPGSTKALWNFAFSVSTTEPDLLVGGGGGIVPNGVIHPNAVGPVPNYWISVSGAVTLAPLNLGLIPDNAYGNSTTPNGGGTVGLYAALAGTSTVMQNSENIIFFGGDPNVAGVYDISLYETLGSDPNGTEVNAVNAEVVVGSVHSAPDGGSTLGLAGIGLACLAYAKRRLLMS